MMTTLPHILLLTDCSDTAGAEMMLSNMVKTLRHRFRFSLIVLRRSGDIFRELPQIGISTFELDGFWARKWNPLSVFRIIHYVTTQEVHLIHTWLFKAHILGAVASAVTRCPLLVHDQSDTFPNNLRNVTYRHYFGSAVMANLYERLYSFVIWQSRKIITLSSRSSNLCQQVYHVDPSKIAVLPNAVDVEKFINNSFTDRHETLCKSLHVSESSKLIMMVGRLSPEKDWFTFLRVARRIHDNYQRYECHFLIVGGGPQEAEIRAEIRRQNLLHVHLLGFRDDIPALLREVDVFVLTSRHEPFGIVLLEAMASACPVVSTRSNGTQAIITHGEDGFLAEPGDDVTLAAQIGQILDDPNLRNRVVAQARKKISSRYSSTSVAERLAALYMEILQL